MSHSRLVYSPENPWIQDSFLAQTADYKNQIDFDNDDSEGRHYFFVQFLTQKENFMSAAPCLKENLKVTQVSMTCLPKPERLAESELYWQLIWSSIYESQGWQLPLDKNLRTKTSAGQLVFFAINRHRNVAIRIFERKKNNRERAVVTWIDTIGDIDELVISVARSKRSAKGVRRLMKDWVKNF